MKILAIDDMQDNLISLKALIKDIFGDAGVVTAQNGPEGIRMAAAEDPDVILLDIVMPGMDGFEVCRQLKADQQMKSIPVVFLTAMKADSETRSKALDVGADSFLTKPIDRSELTAEIRAMVKIKTINKLNENEKTYLDSLLKRKTKELELELEERIKTEHALTESKLKYSALFRNMVAGSCVNKLIFMDGKMVDYKILEINPAFERITGLSRNQIVGKSALQVYGEDIRSFFGIFEKVAEKGETADFETYFKPWDKDLHITVSSPEKGFFSFTFTDITDRKQMELALKNSEKKYRMLIETAPDAIYLISSDGKIIEANQSAANMLGVSREELQKYNINDVDYYFTTEEFRDFWSKIPYNTTRVFETTHKRKDGNIIPVEISGQKFQIDNVDFNYGIARNITERKRLDEILRESEQKHRFLFENTNFGIVYHSKNGEIVDANQAAADILGLTIEQLTGKTSVDFRWHAIHEDGSPYPGEIHPAMISLKTGKPLRNAVMGVFNPKSENYRWININSFPRYRENEKDIFQVIVIFEDITEQKMAEMAIREREANIKSLIENTLENIWSIDRDYRIKYVNDQFVRQFHEFFGVKLSKGDRITDFMPEPLKSEWIRRYEKAFAGEHLLFTDKLEKNGKKAIIEVSMSPIIVNNEVTGISFYGRDVTEKAGFLEELSESEKKFKDLFENNMDSISINYLNDDGTVSNFIECNQNAANLIGYTREEIFSKFPSDIEVKIPEEEFKSRLKKLQTEGLVNFETKLITKSGDQIDAEVKVKLITYNQRPALINITRDITSRKKSEENLRNSEAALRALNATKDKFFSIIAHDLRNPFSSIMGFSEILKDEAESLSIGDIKNYAGMINTAAGQTYRLLENLLEWANMQQGKISFNPKLLVLKEMAIDILETITDTAAMKQISVVSHIPGNLIVRADEEMLRTVLRNLLNNALKFTPAGGTIELLAKKNETGVEVLVKDTGVGISSENLEKLFDVGTSYTTRGTNNEKGTGLGLILCREFVERHGGRISVTSKPGEGSTFTFTLPGKVDSAPEPLSGAKEKFPRSDDHLNRQTILLVEDDPTSALLYRKMLSARFKKVLHAESGFEAIELFNNNPDISLILMDIKMPDMDGNETTQKIRAISKKVIIIALTALASSEERNKALNSGCDEYLTKPVKFDELIAVISNFIPKQN